MYPFSYEVVSKTISIEEPNSYCLESGMSFANSYAEAAKLIEEYYRDDLISIKNLILYEESSLLLLPPEIIKKWSNDEYLISNRICDINGDLI